jgi:hypothetical protein
MAGIFVPDTTVLKMNRFTQPKLDEGMEIKPKG